MFTFTEYGPAEKGRLLKNQQEELLPEDLQVDSRHIKSRLRTVLVHISVIFIYTIVTATFLVSTGLYRPKDSQRFEDPHPFLNFAIRYRPRRFVDYDKSPYIGPPSPAIDEAWAALFDDANIRVTKNELSRLGQNLSSVALNNGDETTYLAWLEVSHQIHCVQYLRQATYPAYYHSNLTPDKSKILRIHIDHCLSHLLQTTLCHFDTELKLFEWDPEYEKPVIKGNYDVPRMCVDVNHLKMEPELFGSRVVSHEEMRGLRNPLRSVGEEEERSVGKAT